MYRFILLVLASLLLSAPASAGAFSSDVACVQSKLLVLSKLQKFPYYAGVVDGLAGLETQGAVDKATEKLGLRPTPLATPFYVSDLCHELARIEATYSDDPTLQYVTDLSPGDPTLKLILEGVRAQRKFSGKTEIVAEVYVYRNTDALVSGSGRTAQDWDNLTAATPNSNMYFKYSDASRLTSFELLKTAAHEAFHAHQYVLMGRPFDGPTWWVEGSANYLAYLALGDEGLRQWALRRKALDPKTPLLSNSTRYQKSNESVAYYDAATAAVELLIEKTSLEKVKTGYWAARAASTESWEQTFERIYGFSADEFLKMLAQSRLASR